MTYKETLDFLYSQLPAYHRIGKAAYKNDLHNTLALDDYFKHPHRNYRTIHVAGTNGKGSVSHMIASVLQEAGYRTGLYTSPHLRDFRERIRVNGEMITEEEVVAFVENHISILETIKPSFFEMSVAMALSYFEDKKTDIAVIEVGLGGRLDSTNIISPILSVITNIGHDHMDLLGNTFEKVAFEKAGIIKKGVPVVIGETNPFTFPVFTASSNEKQSEIFFSDQNFTCILDPFNIDFDMRGFTVREKNKSDTLTGIIPLSGDYQEANLRTIFQIYSCLKPELNLNDSNLVRGIENVIKNTGLQGRWQILGKKPMVICDTGHNLEGLEYVIKQVLKINAAKRHMILGFVSDKDLDLVLPLFPLDSEYYFTKASVPRAMDEKRLQGEASRFGLKGASYPTVKEAFNDAVYKSGPDDLIFIGGSTFVVAEVI
jgi:dihydrofolate synthase / folylpolyglutamate synthase